MDVTISRLTIPEGKKGTKITVAQMWNLVNKNYNDRYLIGIATLIMTGVPAHDELGEANAIFNYVKKHIVWRRDPDGTEFVRDPFVTLMDKVGDCDCQAVLVASLAKAAGFPVRFTTVSTQNPEYWNHVFAEINVAGVWLAADTTEEKSYLGWRPKAQYGEKIWDDPNSKIITEGGNAMAYIPTAGEQLTLLKLTGLRDKIKSWGWTTSWDAIRIDRDQLKAVSASANANLTDPKKSYVTGTLDALWNGFSTWKKSGGYSAIQSIYVRNLGKLITALGLQPAEVTKIVEVLVEKPAAPSAAPAPLAPGAPDAGTETPVMPAGDKWFGLPKKAVAIGGVIVMSGLGYWLWKRRNKR